MRILLIYDIFMPDYVGGGEIMTYNIAKTLIKHGHDVKVLTTGNPKIKSYDGIETIRLPVNRFFLNGMVYPIYNYAKDFDIIHIFNYNSCLPSWLVSKLLNKPIVCTILGIYLDEWLEIKGQIVGRMFKIIEKIQVNRSFDRIIFFSNFSRKLGLKMGIPRNITNVIEPGIEFEKFKKSKKEPFVLFVGRLSKQKGLDYLIESANRLKDIRFLIVGDGPERKNLEKKSPPNVEFLGFIKRSDKKLVNLYSKALVFCLPSIGEGLPLVLLESMSSGCAIVSTIPFDYYGIHVKFRDVDGLTKAIKFLINNHSLSEKYGEKNRKKVKKYTWERHVSKLEKIYEKILHEH